MVPGDEGVQATQTLVRDALSPACERLVARVVSGDEDQEARELVLETLTDHAMPTAWRAPITPSRDSGQASVKVAPRSREFITTY